MTAKQAINQSIHKWEDVCFKNDWNDSCALCNYANDLYEDDDKPLCTDCPIKAFTGTKLCKRTSFYRSSDSNWVPNWDEPEKRLARYITADHEMLLMLYMLKIAYPNVTVE